MTLWLHKTRQLAELSSKPVFMKQRHKSHGGIQQPFSGLCDHAEPKGFTLLEVLVSVGLLVLISSITYGALSVSVASQAEVMHLQERYHAGRVAISKMGHDLSCAFLSRHVSITEKNRETLFLGDEDKVTFTYLGHFRWLEPETPESDQGVVSYFVRSEGGKRQLVRREKTIIDDNPEKGGNELVLAEDVKSLEFQYWDPVAEDWTDEWKAELETEDVVTQDAELERTKSTVEKASGMETVEDTFILPPKVRIKLILTDKDDFEYPFIADYEIRMRKAFSW